MIKAVNIHKSFGGGVKAVDGITVEIEEGKVFGLLGTNGAGKSTVLRLLSGIYRSDEGEISVDGEKVYENPAAKVKIFYISDEQFFPQNSSPLDLSGMYCVYYPSFDARRYKELLERFGLPLQRKIRTFSKGMKKQLGIICALAAGTKYMFCDETFDGLDPVMRQAVKSILAGEMEDRGLTPVIASHSLRELEDICDHVGLLHRGGMLMSRDLCDAKGDLSKLQFVLPKDTDEAEALRGLDILNMDHRGSLITLTCRGERDEIQRRIEELNPVFFEMLPLTLEEIFISETGVKGYDIKKIIG